MEQRISLITLGVTNLSRSIQFYENLGWTVAPMNNRQMAYFQLNGCALVLCPAERLAQAQGQSIPLPVPGGITLGINLRTVEDVDSLMEDFAREGGTVIRKADLTQQEGYTGYAADPDGHVWEISCIPSLTVLETGNIALPSK